MGSEKGSCYPNGTCNAGLACLSSLCVVLSDAGSATGGNHATGGATGIGGTANVGGTFTAGGANIGGGGTGSTAVLAITPANTLAIIDLSADAGTSVTYKVTEDTRDVSSSAQLMVSDSALGSFAGPILTTAKALPQGASSATTTVHAAADGLAASTGLWLGALRKSGSHRDLLFTDTQGAVTPQNDILKFATNITMLDVMFLVQTSGSMGGALTNVTTNLPTVTIPNLVKAIPNLGIGVASFVDYPVSPFGSPSPCIVLDYPVKVDQLISLNMLDAQSAATGLQVNCGYDTPSSALPAMHHLLTGEALTWSTGSVPVHTPASDHFGGADFRASATPVIVTIFNTDWHDTADSPYSAGTPPLIAPTLADVKADFVAKNARFIGVTLGTTSEAQANDLSDATKSNVPASAFGSTCGAGQCCTDVSGNGRAPSGPGGTCRLNFLADAGGSGISNSIINAIQALSVGTQYDVTVALSNEPSNPGGVDATKFLQPPTALANGDSVNACPAHTAKDTNGDGVPDTFVAVIPGTPLCFQMAPIAANLPAATNTPQIFVAYIDVLGMPGSVKLDHRVVLFVVPAKN